ncbi:MAG: GNAT family N-acetyltransferase [Oscillospiraceae bacterium]|nr:GNAT family N-acetyltransferase [Oscillospiraceae bacterium]
MNHKGTKRIETERLILRQAEPNDGEKMYRNWATEEKVTQFMSWPPHSSPDVSKQLIQEWMDSYGKNEFYFWMIELKNNHELIGSISVVEISEKTQSVEIGYGIGSKWWGNGYTAEAANGIMKYLFEEIGVFRICAKHATGNPNSGRVMQKIGMQQEGILRQSGKCNLGIVDMVHYSILRNEYFK